MWLIGLRTRLVSMRILVQSVALLSGLRIWHGHKLGVGCRCGSDPVLLWLWCRQAAAALIRPLAGVALKTNKKKSLVPDESHQFDTEQKPGPSQCGGQASKEKKLQRPSVFKCLSPEPRFCPVGTFFLEARCHSGATWSPNHRPPAPHHGYLFKCCG